MTRDILICSPVRTAIASFGSRSQIRIPGTFVAIVDTGADLAHPDRRGAEIGAFQLVTGIAALPASIVAGWLYKNVATSAPFYLGAAAAVIAIIVLAVTSGTTPVSRSSRT